MKTEQIIALCSDTESHLKLIKAIYSSSLSTNSEMANVVKNAAVKVLENIGIIKETNDRLIKNTATSYSYDFPMAASTVTCIVSRNVQNKYEVLLVKRKPNSDAFPDMWCLPGGFIDIGSETSLTAASRELLEETGLSINPTHWRLSMVNDDIGCDPRYNQIMNICYRYFFNDVHKSVDNLRAGDDVYDIGWFRYRDAHEMTLAFNHNKLLRQFGKIIKHI